MPIAPLAPLPTSWSAQQYVAFEDERTRPVRDLVAAIPPTDAHTNAQTGAQIGAQTNAQTDAQSAIDLGCGPGNSTAVLAARFPAAAITGIDSSPDMIAAARARLPALRFSVADIATWDDRGPFDAILANAVLQWLPDHETLLPRLAARLAPGGSLAIQMPDNLDEPTHRLMRQLAADGPWSAKLAAAAATRTAMADAGWFYALLRPQCRRVEVWRTTYFHPLAGGADAVVEWFKGSGLRPFLAPLDPAERSAYLSRYRDAVAAAYPALPDGAVLLPLPRLFIVATR